MLQGLAIRQVFILLDGILVALMLTGGGLALYFAFTPANKANPTLSTPASDSTITLTPVKKRPEYDALANSSLFGASTALAANSANDAANAPAEADTELHLTLKGTSATSPKDLFASAIIENKDSGITDTFHVSESVSDDATLEEVYPAKVVLFNHRTQRKEILRIDDVNLPGNPAPTAASAGAPHGGRAPHPQNVTNPRKPIPPRANTARGPAVSVPKQQIVEQVLSNPSDTLTKLQPEIARDASGNPTGLTAKNLESLPIAKTLGLQNGDVLQSVNGEMVDSVSKIAEIAGKYGNASSVNITVLRNGKPITMTYNLE